MFAFETAKQFLFPHIAIWQSHFATIGFVSILSGLTAYVLGKRIQSLDADSRILGACDKGLGSKPELFEMGADPDRAAAPRGAVEGIWTEP
jgi:hypothetical protein